VSAFDLIPNGLGRRSFLRLLVISPAAALAACSQAPRGAEPTPLSRLGDATRPPGQINPVVAVSDLGVGTNQRFLMAFIDPDNRPITDATVEYAFFKVTGPGTAQLRSRAPAIYRESPTLPGRGVYVTRADFDEAGDWGVAARLQRPGAEPLEIRTSFTVSPKTSSVPIGSRAPASETPVARTQQEVERICSARPGDNFHQLSIADALRQQRPLAVLFATPGFCTSMTCGPSLDVLTALNQQVGEAANFIHVEIYKDARPSETVPSVSEWGLKSEPWLFIVGADGTVLDKFEGVITVDEVQPSLEQALRA
jgi:hypothetical protein